MTRQPTRVYGQGRCRVQEQRKGSFLVTVRSTRMMVEDLDSLYDLADVVDDVVAGKKGLVSLPGAWALSGRIGVQLGLKASSKLVVRDPRDLRDLADAIDRMLEYEEGSL